MRIFSEARKDPDFDNIPFEDLQEMVGWVEPPCGDDEHWHVTMADGCGFSCSTQEIAHIMASIEEIKAKVFR